jgi:hypothetical protein
MGLVGLAAAANATTLVRLSFDDLARQATTITRARCLASSSVWRNGEIWTETEFEVLEVRKGTASGIMRISLPGGRVDHLQSHVDGVPAFRAGEEVYLFLWNSRGPDTYVLGWTQGTFRIKHDPQTALERVTQDSASMPIFDAATREFRHGGVRNLPLAVFQLKLKRALEKANR